jgi:hypothetical protein
MENAQGKIVWAQARRGRKGPNDIIFVLPNGKIAFPRGFTPREGEWYDIEVEDRDRYAIARLHRHRPTEYGVCPCGKVVDRRLLNDFAMRWIEMLNKQRIDEIKKMKNFVLGRLDALIDDLEEMIRRLYKMAEPHTASVNMCPGYPTTDSCFADLCTDEECVKLNAIIMYLERLRSELSKRRQGVSRALDYDIIITLTPFGVERIFVPGI